MARWPVRGAGSVQEAPHQLPPVVAVQRGGRRSSSGHRAPVRAKKVTVANRWLMCKGTPGTPDACLLCRLRTAIGEDHAGSANAQSARGGRRRVLAEDGITRCPSASAFTSYASESHGEDPPVVGIGALPVVGIGGAESEAAAARRSCMPKPDRRGSDERNLRHSEKSSGGSRRSSLSSIGSRSSQATGPGDEEVVRLVRSDRSSAGRGVVFDVEGDGSERKSNLRTRRANEEHKAFASSCRDRNKAVGLSDDRVSTVEAKQRASSAFNRYFEKGTNRFCRLSATEALADFGLQASTPLEAKALATILERSEEAGSIDYAVFLRLLEDCRLAFRSLYASPGGPLSKAWRYIDRVEAGGITKHQLVQLMMDLHLAPPRNHAEEEHYKVLVEALPWDLKVCMSDLEDFIMRVREIRQSISRQIERNLQDEHAISDEVFDEIRSELPQLFAVFELADDLNDMGLCWSQVTHVLADFGCLHGGAKQREQRAVAIKEMFDEDVSGINFDTLLVIVQNLRHEAIAHRQHETLWAIRRYDEDGSGEFPTKSLVPLLTDLDLHPRSSAQRDQLEILLEQAETKASADDFLDYKDVEKFLQQVTECYLRVEREIENAVGDALEFSRPEVYHMRAAYEVLEAGSCAPGSDLDDLQRVVRMLHLRTSRSQLSRFLTQIDDDTTGYLNFVKFMKLVRLFDDEAQTEFDGAEDGQTEESEFRPKSFRGSARRSQVFSGATTARTSSREIRVGSVTLVGPNAR